MYLPFSQLIAAGRPPDHPIAVRNGRPIRFSAFRADVLHNAARLREARCRRGLLACSDSYWFATGLLALFQAGAAVILPPNMQPGTLGGLAEAGGLLVGDTRFPGMKTLILESGGIDLPAPSIRDPASILIEFYTSGSTGSPKRVTRSAQFLEREVELVRAHWGAQVTMGLASATVSHQHAYGLVFKLLWPLSCGWPFSARTHMVWETLLDELEPGGILVTSPAHLSRMAGLDPIESGRAPAVVLSAGAPLPASAARKAAETLRVAPTEMFGSTETGVFAIRPTNSSGPWRPLPGVRFNRTAERRLKVWSPAVPGDGWYELADVVDLSADGGFHHRGRSDRVVKIEGKRISLPAVEQELATLPWVTAAAVTVVGGEIGRLGAVVVLDSRGREMLEELGEFRLGRMLRSELARRQESAGLPRLWRFVDVLPSGEMGKSRDRDLASLFVVGAGQ